MIKLDEATLTYLRQQTRRHAGWEKYREKSKTNKKKHSPIYNGVKRQNILNEVMNVLSDWRLSPFEFEGDVRAGLRSSLCLQGYPWVRADTEAAEIIAACLTNMRAARPSWDEGQKEYTTARENCSWCGCRVPDDLLTGKARHYGFCSEKCARRAIQERNLTSLRSDTRAFVDAWDVIQRANSKTIECVNCGKAYKPLFGRGKYCSMHCSSEAQRRVPKKTCCKCGSIFWPHSNKASKGHFCSNKCRYEFGFTTKYDRVCIACGVSFVGKVPSAKCCSSKCAVFHSTISSGKRVPKRLSAQVFDYYFKRAA